MLKINKARAVMIDSPLPEETTLAFAETQPVEFRKKVCFHGTSWQHEIRAHKNHLLQEGQGSDARGNAICRLPDDQMQALDIPCERGHQICGGSILVLCTQHSLSLLYILKSCLVMNQLRFTSASLQYQDLCGIIAHVLARDPLHPSYIE